MKKQTFTAAAFLSTLLASALAGALLANLVAANPFFPKESWSDEPTPPLINVQSPLQNQFCGFDGAHWLNFTVTKPLTSWHRSDGFEFATTIGEITSVQYSLDGEIASRITARDSWHEFLYFSINLGVLSDGQHTIKIEAEGLGHISTTITHDLYPGSEPTFKESVPTKQVSKSVQISIMVRASRVIRSESKVYFNVDNTAPKVSVLSPASLTYNSPDVPLSFSVDEDASEIAYSLDGESNVTVSDSTILSDLSYGQHSLRLYAWDETGNVGASETVTFTVATFPTTLVTAAVGVVAVVCAGVLLYFIKFKKRRTV